MAPAGHTSMQARQSVHAVSATSGRPRPGDRAAVGQVIRQAPQAVQLETMRTVTGDSPAA